MTIVKSVEELEISLSDTQTSNTGTLTKGQVAANCVPFTTISHTKNTSEQFDRTTVRVTISGSTVTVTRNASGGSVVLDAIVHIVEFDPSVSTVQTGEATSVENVFNDSPGTNFANLAKTFIYFGYTVTHVSDDYNDSQISGKITSTSNIQFNREASTGSATVRWYSVECSNTEFDVQRDAFVITSQAETAQSIAFTAVDTARTMVIASYRTTEGQDDTKDGSCMIDLVDSTHVGAERSNGGAASATTITVEFQVIQFEAIQVDGVDRGEFTISGTSDTDTIGQVDLTRTLVKSQDPFGSASMNSADGDDIGQRNARMDMQSDTVVRGRVTTNAITGVWKWEVVEFILSVAPSLKRHIAPQNVSLQI